jgi:hypothetical protein
MRVIERRQCRVLWGHNSQFIVGPIGMVSLEFKGLGAGEIKRDPEVETLLVTKDKPTEIMKKALNWLAKDKNPLPRREFPLHLMERVRVRQG